MVQIRRIEALRTRQSLRSRDVLLDATTLRDLYQEKC